MWKLIIVDDEKKTREVLHSIIPWESLGVVVAGIASDGEEGLALVRATAPDIIITDVRMPRMDGITFATEVRKLLPLCQIIFISGYSDKEYLKSAITLKAISYVEKPISIGEIEEAVRKALTAVENERESQKLTDGKTALELIAPAWIPGFADKLALFHPGFANASCYRTLICQFQYSADAGGTDSERADRPADNEALDKRAYCEIKNALTAQTTPYLLAQKQPCIFIIHLCSHQLQDSVPEHAVNSVYTRIKQTVAPFATVFIAAGSSVTRLEDIRKSYIDSVLVLQELFYTGYSHLYFFRPADPNAKAPFAYDSSIVSKFSLALKHDTREAAAGLVAKLSHSIRNAIPRFETNNSIKNIYYQLLMELSRLCDERGLAKVFSNDSDFIWDSVANKETLLALTDYLLEKVEVYYDEVAGIDRSHSLVHAIRQYIDAHYAEPDLSINRIAQELHFTPAYLSQVFKRETGATINGYLTGYRLEKAKLLLKQKNKKLIEISMQVGYPDANYFTRQFRKYVGTTPSEFREKYLL
ncbi:MAG: two-component response regulator, CheY-like domain protein [Paenibacillaceae bacterium]|nr:two-component response regulator, CheY-like domain protein [Paenibacillaceae bacterium]